MLVTLLPLRAALSFQQGRLQSGALFDAIRCCVLALCVWLHVAWIEPGMLYFGMKDVTAEFQKITLVYVALDVADKVTSLTSKGHSCEGCVLLRLCAMLEWT